MANDCGCGPVSVGQTTTTNNQPLATAYQVEYGGQAVGDATPTIRTSADRIVWSPLPPGSVYDGAACLTDATDDTYREIFSGSDWMHWFEKYPAAAYCAQTRESCQWSYAANGVAKIDEGLTSCLGLDETNYLIVWNQSGQAIAGKIGFDDIGCDTINDLLGKCVTLAATGEEPASILGIDVRDNVYRDADEVEKRRDNIIAAHRYTYTNRPAYIINAKILANTNNNRHPAATKGTRYTLRNVQFERLQNSNDLISQFDTAVGRLVCSSDVGVWITMTLTVSVSLEYTPTNSNDSDLTVNLGYAEIATNGAATRELRLRSRRFLLISGSTQTGHLNAKFTFFMKGAGAAIEPRIWIGGRFAGQVNLQIAQNEARLSVHTEETLDYRTENRFFAA